MQCSWRRGRNTTPSFVLSETKWCCSLQATASWERPTKETALTPPARRKVRRSSIIFWCFLLLSYSDGEGQTKRTKGTHRGMYNEWPQWMRPNHVCRQSKGAARWAALQPQRELHGERTTNVFIFGGLWKPNPHISRLYLSWAPAAVSTALAWLTL